MTSPQRSTLITWIIALGFQVSILIPSALAFRPHTPAGLGPQADDLLVPWIQVQQAPADPDLRQYLQDNDLAFADFLAAVGGEWVARYDIRTARPTTIYGSGLPTYPGRGNDLKWDELGTEPQGRKAHAEWLEAWARNFMEQHPGLFQVPDNVELRRSDNSGTIGDGKVSFIDLRAYRDGVPVPAAFVTFRWNSGNLVQFGSSLIHDTLARAATVPEITSDDALEVLEVSLSELFAFPGEGAAPRITLSEVVDAGTLALMPTAEGDHRWYSGNLGEGLDYRLVWDVTGLLPGRYESWRARVDARTGELVTLEDSNMYACPIPADPQGRVTGGVFLGPIEDVPESIRPMPYARINNGPEFDADYNGLFPLDPMTPASTGLNGQYFDMNCDGCSNPPQVFREVLGATEIFLGLEGADEVGNGFSTRAERNCYYHLNVVRQLADKHLDPGEDGGLLSVNMPSNVNIADTCNAFATGATVNFFRSGGGCNNTGDIADVMQHEWGHNIDIATNPGFETARSEGISDVIAFLSTHDPNLGPYFLQGNINGIRNADETVVPIKTAGNIDMECGPGPGALGRQQHCEGGIISQTNWRMARELRVKLGETAGWFMAERLFFGSLPISNQYVPDLPDSMYDAYFVVDDDDGNLMNGTPNGETINDAFVSHEIASTPLLTDSADCTPIPAPDITLERRVNMGTNRPQIQVTWTEVPAAVEYGLYRNESGRDTGDIQVGTFFPPATTFLDDNVAEGVTYAYRVQAFDATCFSVDDNRQELTTVALPNLGLVASLANEAPGGNANGIPEPGERVELVVEVGNLFGGPALDVVGTLETAEPDVTIVTDTNNYGDLDPGMSRTSVDPHFVFDIGPDVPCGSVLTFTLELQGTDACTNVFVQVPVGELEPIIDIDDLETNRGWQVNPDATDTATTGQWVLMDPTATPFQPGDDVTPTGTMCWMTGDAADGDCCTDDVDGGCTTLLSPVYDQGGTPGLSLAYWRFYVLETEFDDVFTVEISNDAGRNWMPLETLDATTPTWQRVVFNLDATLGEPANELQLRFTACDEGAGSLIEALVDDLMIFVDEPRCESVSPEPILVLDGFSVDDGGALGGFGNDNGNVDPGETVKVAMDLRNVGSGVALDVVGTAVSVTLPTGVVLTDSDIAWVNIDPDTTETSGASAIPHLEIDLPRPEVGCEGEIVIEVTVTYLGEDGIERMLVESITLSLGIAPILDNFDLGDIGWTTASDTVNEWERETPMGVGRWDPDMAFSGTRIWGTDLSNNGLYEPDSETSLVSPPFDCTAYDEVVLSFQRWLTVQNGMFDQAIVEVNGTEIWRNGTDSDHIDREWMLQEFDITALAAGNPSVVVTFRLNSDAILEFGGWNIDDLILRDPTPCTGILGCEIFPRPGVVGPVLRANGHAGEVPTFIWPSAVLETDAHFVLKRGTT
ncbi:MAG: hypothetical protein AAF533_28250, partial [Acidobacteriota bacterium]